MERTALLDNGHQPGQSGSAAGRKLEGRAAAQPGQAKAREELDVSEDEGGMPELTLRQALVRQAMAPGTMLCMWPGTCAGTFFSWFFLEFGPYQGPARC